MHQSPADFLNFFFFIDRLNFGNQSECDGVFEPSLRLPCDMLSIFLCSSDGIIFFDNPRETIPNSMCFYSEGSSPTLNSILIGQMNV